MAGFYQTSRFHTAWVISRHKSHPLDMSAFGGKADVNQAVAEGPLLANNTHSKGN